MEIRLDDLHGAAIAQLLQEHLDDMYRITPAESVHALDLGALRASHISFWCAWEGEELLGCGALKQLDEKTGEIKSMRTARNHRNKGVAAMILEHIIETALDRGYSKLMLETGVFPEFEPARRLYQRYGFSPCGPFEPYQADSNSVFMRKCLDQL